MYGKKKVLRGLSVVLVFLMLFSTAGLTLNAAGLPGTGLDGQSGQVTGAVAAEDSAADTVAESETGAEAAPEVSQAADTATVPGEIPGIPSSVIPPENRESSVSSDAVDYAAAASASVPAPALAAAPFALGEGEKDILLIQTSLPWNSGTNSAVLGTLSENGYSTGFDICSVDQFNSGVDVSKYKVIMFANDQTTATYQRYEYIADELEFFAKSGGTVIFGACDNGWGGNGSLTGNLPGGVRKISNLQYNNYIVDSTSPILTGELTGSAPVVNSDLSGNYCSHTSFDESTLPNGANVILRGTSDQRPTLVEYPYGNGRIIISGLTWEYYYIGGPGYNTSGRYSAKAFDDLIVYALSNEYVEVAVTAEKTDGSVVNVEGADVNLYVGADLHSSVKTNAGGIAKVITSGLSADQRRNATLSASFVAAEGSGIEGGSNLRNKLFSGFGEDASGEPIRYIYELHSEKLNYNGQWVGVKLADADNGKIALRVSEPRIRINLAVAYLANDSVSRSDAYLEKLKRTITNTAQDLSQTTDGHVLLNDVLLIRARTTAEFYHTLYRSSMADLRIETVIDVVDEEKIHSNAYPQGFYNVNMYNADGGRKTFPRIQMSGTEGAGWNIELGERGFAETVTHELGHYLLGFLDEYLASDGNMWKESGRGDSAFTKPTGVDYGLMDNQHEDIEMSKSSTDYSYLDGDFSENSEQTLHSVVYRESTEDTLAHWLELLDDNYAVPPIRTAYAGEIPGFLRSTTLSDLDYSASYSRAVTHDRTASYPYAKVNSFIDLGSDDGVLDLPDTPIAAAGIAPRIAAGISAADVMAEDTDEDILPTGVSIPDGSGGFMYTYMSDSYNVSGALNSDKEFEAVYETVPGETLTYGDYITVSEPTGIKVTGEGAVTGDFYSEVSYLRNNIDFSSLSWVRFANETAEVLPTEASFEPESVRLGQRAPFVGDGIYVLMAKPASKTVLDKVSEIKQSGSAKRDGDATITFTDTNDAGLISYYEIIYSDTPFVSADGENVLRAVYFPSENGEYTIPLYERNKEGFAAVVARGMDGSASPLSEIAVITGGEADNDEDGLPDWWVDNYFLWDFDGSKDIPNSDDDSDGLINLEEYRQGKDPTVPDAGDTAYIPGDVNQDGVLNSADASVILLYIVGKTQLSDIQLTIADISGDGAVNSADSALILITVNSAVPANNDAVNAELTVGSGEAEAGTYIDIPVTISAGTNAYSAEFEIDYDPALLAFDTAQRMNAFGLEQINSTGEGKLKLAFASDTAVISGGEIAALTFRVLGKCDPATVIAVGNGAVYGINGELGIVSLPVIATDGYIVEPGAVIPETRIIISETDTGIVADYSVGGEQGEFLCVLALYDDRGALVDVLKEEFAQNSRSKIGCDKTEDWAFAKAFIWRQSDFAPMCGAAEFPGDRRN